VCVGGYKAGPIPQLPEIRCITFQQLIAACDELQFLQMGGGTAILRLFTGQTVVALVFLKGSWLVVEIALGKSEMGMIKALLLEENHEEHLPLRIQGEIHKLGQRCTLQLILAETLGNGIPAERHGEQQEQLLLETHGHGHRVSGQRQLLAKRPEQSLHILGNVFLECTKDLVGYFPNKSQFTHLLLDKLL